MTLVLDGAPLVEDDERRGWRRYRPLAVVLSAVALVLSWTVVAQHPQLQPAGWGAVLDARPLQDGVSTTRYVLVVDDGERGVLTSIRNDGPLPLTVLGAAEERNLPWVRATFRDVGQAPPDGFSSAAAARAAVTASSVTLEPGAMADVLVHFEAPAHVSMTDGSFSELQDVALTVRYLGLESVRSVPIVQEPLTLIGTATAARLEREGRFGTAP